MKRSLVLVLALHLAGCAQVVLDKGAKAPSGDDSIFVIGVSPANYRVTINPGSIEKGRFDASSFWGPVFSAFASEGYIVARASRGDQLAIMAIMADPGPDKAWAGPYLACQGPRTMTFEVPAGRVIYLGHVAYEQADQRLQATYHQDFDSAKQYIDAQYPNLKGLLVAWPYEMRQTTSPCTVIQTQVMRY